MEIPRQLKIGEETFNYETCNYYQQVIYREIVSLAGLNQSLKDDVSKVKHAGVIEYLCSKLKVYASLTPAKNFYEHDELTKSM